jgi:hypothetical protein
VNENPAPLGASTSFAVGITHLHPSGRVPARSTKLLRADPSCNLKEK